MRNPTSVPRSITTSGASTAPSKRSKWRSHYQQTQQHENLDASIGIPFFLLDDAENSKDDNADRGLGHSADIDISVPPTPMSEPRQQPFECARIGSFGIVPPTYPFPEGSTLTPYDSTAVVSTLPYQRSSASSYNSLLTSGTSRSRSSYTSVTGPSEPSPTTSEYPASLSSSQPRLGYGSAFGGHEDTMLTADIVRMAVDMRDSLILARRSSRKRSSTDATLIPPVLPPVTSKELPPIPTPLPQCLPFASPKKPSTSVPRSQWPQFGISASRSEQRFTAVVAPVPLQLHATNTPGSRPGTVVKKSTIATKGRLPIGSTQQVPQRPKTPSNTLPAGTNLSLQSKSFCAPAYAMSAPKIPGSTRTLHTSPPKKSLKGQKDQGSVQIPRTEVEHSKQTEEGFKASFESKPFTIAQDFRGPDILVVNEENFVSSTHTGSPFKLSVAHKPQRCRNLTLKLDSASLSTVSTSTPEIIPCASPSGAQDRSPSTAGGPLTPRATSIGSRRPVWLISPVDKSADTDPFRPMTIE
jgi:hypothetical protein